MKTFKAFLEGKKVTVKSGKYLVFPDGSLTSLSDGRHDGVVVIQNRKGSEAVVYYDDGKPYAEIDNSWDKDFKNLDDLAKWLNKEGYTDYIGID